MPGLFDSLSEYSGKRFDDDLLAPEPSAKPCDAPKILPPSLGIPRVAQCCEGVQ